MKLKYQWPLVWALVCLTPFREALALPAAHATLWQHLLWPLAHANILHWLINTFCFMALWRFITLPRLLWGYAASVAIGYLWCWCSASAGFASCSTAAANSSFFILYSSLKLCGLSSIIFFLLGTIFVRARKRYRIRLALLVIISCFIPNIAASVHIASLFAGILYSRCARYLRSRVSHLTFYTIAIGFVSTMFNAQ